MSLSAVQNIIIIFDIILSSHLGNAKIIAIPIIE